MWGALIGAAIAGGISLYQGAQAAKEKKRYDKKAQEALAAEPDYAPTKSARSLLAEASVNKNAVNPALQMAYRQAQQGAANQAGLAQRNATSGAEALAVGSAAQNNLQAAIPGIAAEQTQFNMANRGAYMQALDKMSAEERMQFEANRAKNSNLVNYYIGRTGAANANMNSAIMGGVGALAQAGTTMGRYNWNQNPQTTPQVAQQPDNSYYTNMWGNNPNFRYGNTMQFGN